MTSDVTKGFQLFTLTFSKEGVERTRLPVSPFWDSNAGRRALAPRMHLAAKDLSNVGSRLEGLLDARGVVSKHPGLLRRALLPLSARNVRPFLMLLRRRQK